MKVIGPTRLGYLWDNIKSYIASLLDGKQDVINDLAVIRSGAALGATALQSFTESDPTVPAWAKAANKPSYTAAEVGAVPTTRTVNGKALSSDITLSASDVSALPSSTTIPSVILSNNYSTSTDTNEDLLLESGDTFEEAFGKLEKAILDNEDVYAAAFNDLNGRLQEKEKCITISGYSKTADFTANVGLYYNVSVAASTSITITLATPNDNAKLSSCVFFVTTSTSPTLTFAAASGVTIYKSKDFAIEESTYYEVNALWNGTSWYIAQMELEVQS